MPTPAVPVRVSFVVLSFNSGRVIERCIRSIVANMPGAECGERDEILVVENGSSDSAPERLRALQAEFPGIVQAIFLARNEGTTRPRNLALRRAAGRYVAIVDSDVYVPPATVSRLIARLDARPRAGLIAPRLRFSCGEPQLSVDRFPTLPHKARRLLRLRAMERRLDLQAPSDGVLEVDYAISAFWLMRREVVEAVGPFDEQIFYSPEDVDYCVRIWQAGYGVVYDPTVEAIHDAQEISRRFPLRRATLSHIRGLCYFFVKHGFLFSRRRLYRRIGRFRSA